MFVPSVVGAKTVLSDEYHFQKTMLKSVVDVVGEKNLGILPAESYKRVKRLLSAPLSNSLSKFTQKLDMLLSTRFKKLAEDGKSFSVLDFNMKVM